MKKWFKRLNNQKGMTLVELLAVVVILGIVAAIAVPAIGNIINNSKNDAHVSNALLIINAAKLGDVTGMITKDDWTDGVLVSELSSKGLLDAVPNNPSDKKKQYGATSVVTKNTATNKYSIKLFDSASTPNAVVNASEEELNGAAITTTNGIIPGRN